MKVAAALFGEEISPRFDCCTGLLILDEDESEVKLDFRGRTAGARIEEVIRRKPDWLLCGGIRRCDLLLLTECGIRVVHGLTGPARMAVDQCRNGTLKTGAEKNSTQVALRGRGRCRRQKGGRNAES